MYPINNSLKQLILNCEAQYVKMTVRTKDNSFVLKDTDIRQGTTTVDRYSISGSSLEVGNSTAAQLDFTLNNESGMYDDVDFEGAEIFMQVGCSGTSASTSGTSGISWMPMGYFIIDTPPRALSTIKISALDRMIKFAQPVEEDRLKFPMSVADMITKAAGICDVPVGTDVSTLLNADYEVTALPATSKTLTYTNLIQMAGMITGTNAWIDWDGELRFTWYEDSGLVIDETMRFSSDLLEQDLVVTGIYYKDNAKHAYNVGTDDGIMIDISSCGLLTHDVEETLKKIYLKLKGFSYRQFSASTISLPFLYPMDMIKFSRDGEEVNTILSHVHFSVNGKCTLEAKGSTKTSQSYYQEKLTTQQVKIIDEVQKTIQDQMNSREESLNSLNDLISNSFGLYRIKIPQPDGSNKIYLANDTTLEASTRVWTMTSNGFAWTDKYDGENTVWQYGISYDGNAVLNTLSVKGVDGDWVKAHTVTADKLAVDFTNKVNDTAETTQKLTETTTKISEDINGLSADLKVQTERINGVIDNDGLIFQTPYSKTKDTVTFRAVVYKGGEDATKSFYPSQFTWYRASGFAETKIGTGYTCDVKIVDLGLGETIVGYFDTEVAEDQTA